MRLSNWYRAQPVKTAAKVKSATYLTLWLAATAVFASIAESREQDFAGKAPALSGTIERGEETAARTAQMAQADSTYDVQDIPIYNRAWVSEIQSRMKQAGFDPGTESGAFTEKTRDTIKEFQRHNGLRVNGQPTPSVMRKLRSSDLMPSQSG